MKVNTPEKKSLSVDRLAPENIGSEFASSQLEFWQMGDRVPALYETLIQFGEKFDYKSLKELIVDFHAQLDRTEPNLSRP